MERRSQTAGCSCAWQTRIGGSGRCSESHLDAFWSSWRSDYMISITVFIKRILYPYLWHFKKHHWRAKRHDCSGWQLRESRDGVRWFSFIICVYPRRVSPRDWRLWFPASSASARELLLSTQTPPPHICVSLCALTTITLTHFTCAKMQEDEKIDNLCIFSHLHSPDCGWFLYKMLYVQNLSLQPLDK